MAWNHAVWYRRLPDLEAEKLAKTMESSMDKKDVRTQLKELASGLLLGPMDAAEILASPPADTYLTGILWPRGASFGAEEDEADVGEPASGADESEAAIPGYRSVRPCSIGVTFAVAAGATVRIDLGNTARYVTFRPGTGEGMNSSRSEVHWQRKQLDYGLTIDPEETRKAWKTSDFHGADGTTRSDHSVVVHVLRRVAGNQTIFTVSLINAIAEEGNDIESRDARCLFQSELNISASLPDGAAAIRPRFHVPASEDDEDALTNELLYRNEHEYAVGHGVAAMWSGNAGEAVSAVGTSWLPESPVKGTDPNGSKRLLDVFSGYPKVLHAEFLGQEDKRELVLEALKSFANCYDGWIGEVLEPQLPQLSEKLHRKAADFNLKRCRDTLARIVDGIRVLKVDGDAWTAFVMANQAMNRQSLFPSKGERRRPLVWRPFQLAFMLLVVPGLVDPAREDRQCMDLLWFPTGGGKTEAYLGLTAFQIFHRRLISATRRVDGGVDVLMRYTLRLLTVQQFQRAAALISACEIMRLSDARLGTSRISLGLYVGGEATPNHMDDARKSLREELANQNPKSTPRQLLRCPVCGTDLHPDTYQAHAIDPRIDIQCPNPSCETEGVSLPVLTVDETIYATPPSLLIGTIDKFAQIPRRTDMRRIFGMDGGLRPGLIIQDELHLISGPLGSMAGLYETVIDLLCTEDKVRPKIIGSTATIGQAGRQVRALFDRTVLQFPPPGFDASDSFFAVRDETGDDRLYIGISTAGRSPKFALQATVATLLQSAAAMRTREGMNDANIDPYWTCVAYFNSLRELGGAYVLMQDDVPRQMQFLASRLQMKMRKLELQPRELSSRVPSRELPSVLQSLETGLDGGGDPYGETATDTVLASNMISVGVDVPRLGMMVMHGQPKSTAEYIQASSRVGRGMPGLVITIYNFGRPRDVSHFEHFRGYHSALYRRVEATSVTPWAPRARDKALHAVIAAAVRHLVPGMAADDAATAFNPDTPEVQAILDFVSERIDRGSNGVEVPDADEQIANIVDLWRRRSAEARATGGHLDYWEKKASLGKTAPHLMCAAEEGSADGKLAWATPNSMREVEPSTAFVLKKITIKQEKENGNQQI
jgi:hypothetical protein